MLHAVTSVNGGILWANLHLLFWLSLVPFVTRWMGEHYLAALPVAAYGVVLFMNGVAFGILAWLLVRHEGPDSAPWQRPIATTTRWWGRRGLCGGAGGGVVRAGVSRRCMPPWRWSGWCLTGGSRRVLKAR